MSELREGPSNRLRLWSRLQVLVFRALTAVVDAGSPAIRFGFGHAVRRRLLERSLVSLVATEGEAAEGFRSASTSEQPREDASQPLVVLVTRTLGTGGVEAIVASLAQGLPQQGLDCIVLCELGGSTADALRALGIVVVEARDEATAISALADAGSVVAAQLHNAPDHLIAACAVRGIPIVQVVHTTDINLSAEHWLQQSDLHDRSAAIVAVSETVKEFLEFHLPCGSSAPVVVVPNGVAARASSDRHLARQRLGDAIGVQLGETAVVVCLARYDIQKNIPGLVQAFLLAASSGSDARLIVAGPVGDWLEYAHADAIRRAHPRAGRVHLLGSSWSAGILDAADAFVLDSFFEGWPVAASEAVMAGIPLVISDVGGARELVGETATRGVICHNPASDPSTITRAQIRSARTRSVQSNRAELATALRDICQNITQWRLRREHLAGDAGQWLSADTMIAAHARLLHGVRAAADEATSKARRNANE